MNTKPSCGNCGKPLQADAPHGLCPECLFQAGFPTEAAGREPAARFVPPTIEEIAKLFPQLEIIGFIGQGGMGAVYQARQPALDRKVALKILPPALANDPGFAERFNREARALARLSHPNIVAVYDFGQAGDLHYLLMELVEGMNLRQMERAGKLKPEEALAFVPQICEALQFAHSEGIVHRDIKPENLLLDKRGRLKITDFGIAKIAGAGEGRGLLTGAKDVVGTPHYMAPEQLERPQKVDHRADIFSLGVVFYEMLTGELPLGKFQPPSKKVRLDVRLDDVVLHALEKEPERRYQQVSQVSTDVQRITATPGLTASAARTQTSRENNLAGRSVSAARGWRSALLAGAAGMGLILACLTVLFFVARAKSASDPSNAWMALLNKNQRLFVQWSTTTFREFDDTRTFDGWSDSDRTALESKSLDALREPQTLEFYRAINTLAALRSTKALPVLRQLASEPIEKDNRDRWMAVRALGIIGDKTVVPDLIHLLYHYNANTRWWGQVSLVHLTGLNLGSDWEAWGKWWNAQNGQPPFHPELIRWSSEQVAPEALAASLAQRDSEWLAQLSEARAPKEAASKPPLIVSTSPRMGETEVDPATTNITVTFDRDMKSGYSWTGGGPEYPPGAPGQKVTWRDNRTCVLPVHLEPGHYYRVGINSKSYQNFRSVEGASAEPSAIYFTTVGASEELKLKLLVPHAVKLEPPIGAKDVSPDLKELRVTFDVPMGGGFSWCGDGPTYPGQPEGARPHWTEDQKTCVLPVVLKPGQAYEIGLNCPCCNNFQSAAGVPLEPVAYSFATRP